jgi:hypothetical protein
LIEEEKRGKGTALPESSSEDDEDEATETVAAAAAMLKKVPNTKKILRRLTSPVNIAEKFARCGVLYNYVKLCSYDV